MDNSGGQPCYQYLRGLIVIKRLQCIAVVLASVVVVSAYAQGQGAVTVTPEVHHDTLHSLRDTVPPPDGYLRFHNREEHNIPLPHFPPNQVDGALQDHVAPGRRAPAFLTGVDGVGMGFTGPQGSFSPDSAPPDTVGAVGATQYVQVVNEGFAVFNKADKSVAYGPVPTDTLWVGFGGSCEADNDGDAVVVYDKVANRWIISQFAVVAAPYFQCVAVSQTSDATGAWNRYSFSYASVFPDYPKMGVWPDAYYETFNMFNGNTFAGSKLCAYDRTSMLSGTAATQQCFQLASGFGGVLPSDLDGATLPPAGSPNYMLNFGSNSLNLWKFHVDWAIPANTTLTGPTNISVAAFTPACNGGACIVQPKVGHKSAELLDSLADRVMFRLAYRNFGDHESLVVNQSVTAGTSTGVRWYEIRSPGATPAIYQQSTFAPDSSYRWMGSVAMDSQGNMALGYSVSSSTVHPSVVYTGRLADDPLSTMQAETTIFAGSGSQIGSNLDRWGDYSAMTIDPVDDCTFWYTNEYLKTDGAFNWSTRIGSFSFPSCSGVELDQTITFTNPGPKTYSPSGTFGLGATASSGLAVSYVSNTTGVCTVLGSTVTIVTAGSCSITASQAGDAIYNAATPVTDPITISQATQTITFTNPGTKTYSPNGTFGLGATASSGLTVSYVSNTTGVCTVSGSTVTIVTAGSCSITASQAGDTNYNAATSVTDPITISPATQTITFQSIAPGDAAVGGSTYAAAATSTSGLTVILTISAASSAVCTIDGGGVVSFIGIGSCVIDANQAGDTNYSAATQVPQSFSVGIGAATQLVFTTPPSSALVGIGQSVAVSVEDSAGDVETGDNATQISLSVNACGNAVLGTVQVVNGVALFPNVRLYATGTGLKLHALSDTTLSADSSLFDVLTNGDFLFADGFESCMP